MAFRGKKGDRAAHVKRHTVGTSNEISFDVLEAAKENLDAKTAKSNEVKIKRPGKAVASVSLLFSNIHFPSHGSDRKGKGNKSGEEVTGFASPLEPPEHARKQKRALRGAHAIPAEKKGRKKVQTPIGPRTLSAEQASAEIEKRKQRRRRHRIRARALAIVLALVALGVAGWFGYERLMLLSDHDAQIKNLAGEVSQVDERLVKLDELLQDPMANVGSADWQTLKSELAQSSQSLDTISASAKELEGVVDTDEMLSAADQISVACDSRKQMISDGVAIFDEAEKAKEAADSLEDVWKNVVDADEKARSGAAKLSDSSLDEGMATAKDEIAAASGEFNTAKNQLASIEGSYANLDLTAQLEYLETRIASLGYASATADALAARDKELAEQQVALYNETDAKAASLAAALPTAVTSPVSTAFDTNVAALRDDYQQARLSTSAADDVIRVYLGADFK